MRTGQGAGSERTGVQAVGGARAPLVGIAEAPAGRDDQIAAVFRRMRLASGLPPAALAQHLGISDMTLAVLEEGALQAFPDLPETRRIVAGYGRLVGVDGGAIMRRIEAQRGAELNVRSAPRPPVPVSSGTARALPVTPTKPAGARRRSRPARRALWLFSLPMLVAGTVWAMLPGPARMQTAIDRLPEPVADYARAGMHFLLASTAPTHAGLRLIDTGDPRSRKADKLPVRR